MRIEVDTGGYTSACSQLYSANHEVVDAISTLSGALGSASGMAGTDTGGEAWAAQYDAAAGPLLQAGADLGESLGQMANLLNAALVNHDSADYGASIGAGPSGGGFDGDSDPEHYATSVYCPEPPSAKGGTGSQPGWWHWVAGHVEGMFWPDADTGRLRAAGDAWTRAGQAVQGATYAVFAASADVGAQRSPEVADATATLDDVETHLDQVGASMIELGKACSDYAKQVDDHHEQMEDELASFIKWTVGIQAGGAALAFFTAGISEAAAQAAQAAKVAAAATKVVRILKSLAEIARAAASAIGGLVRTAAAAIERVKVILNARVVRALAKVAPQVTKESRSRLLADLAAQGVKHDPSKVVRIFRNAEGKIIFLEKGDAKAGLEHVLKHSGEFATKGIAEKDIPALLETALSEGKIVGQQGKNGGRPIYEVLFHGKVVRIAITVGSNGYIVGANPVS